MNKILILISGIILSAFSPSYCSSKSDSLHNALDKASSDTARSSIMSQITFEYLKQSEYDNAIKFGEEYIGIVTKFNSTATNKKYLADITSYVSQSYHYLAKYDTALDYQYSSLRIFTELKDQEGISKSNYNLGKIMASQGKFPEALKHYNISLKIDQQTGNKIGQAQIFQTIGIFYAKSNETEKALHNLDAAREIFIELGSDIDLANLNTNIGSVLLGNKEYTKALPYYLTAINLYKKAKDRQGMAISLANLGATYCRFFDLDETEIKPFIRSNSTIQKTKIELLDSSEYYFNYSYGEADAIGHKHLMCFAKLYLGEISLKRKRHDKAIEHINEAYNIAESIGAPKEMYEAREFLSLIYRDKGDYKSAYENYKAYTLIKDSLFNEEKDKEIGKIEAEAEYEKKLIAQQAEQSKKDAVALEEKRSDGILRNSLIAGLVLMFSLSLVTYRNYRNKKKANDIITLQKKEVEHQKEIVEEKNKNITDSINYASRIQRALIASDSMLNKYLNQYYILYKPKDIVSGDFYWATQINDEFYLSVSDCTGHGVPGAFMSLLNISFLNEAILRKQIYSPDQILNDVRSSIIKALNSEGGEETKDGMDTVLISVNFKTRVLSLAAANNPLWILRDGEIITIKPDKMPVGLSFDMKPFTLQKISLQKGDILYMFTDGYADQFGGPNGKKFKYKQMQQVILDNHHLPISEQKDVMLSTLESWKGEMEQVDDILLVAVKI